jgi:hypothetical protein
MLLTVTPVVGVWRGVDGLFCGIMFFQRVKAITGLRMADARPYQARKNLVPISG